MTRGTDRSEAEIYGTTVDKRGGSKAREQNLKERERERKGEDKQAKHIGQKNRFQRTYLVC
jgi:hypothetical protein